MEKKLWVNPDICSLLVDETKNDDTCHESNAKCICGHYHFRILGGCGGCSAPKYICVVTGKQPKYTPKCNCNSTPTPSVPVS